MCNCNSNCNCYCHFIGFRFSPSDEELLSYYLWHKISGRDDRTGAIAEVDLCRWEPWELPDRSVIKSDNHVWYFFFRRDNKYARSQRANRATKAGYWKVTGNDRKIHARDTNKQIGTKKTLVFHERRGPDVVGTNWVIHEYTPAPDTMPPNPRAYLVCRLEEKPVEKNSPSRKGECGSSAAASTSNNNAADNAADNALPERGPHLEANTGPFVGNNQMDYELAVQASMEERGLLVEGGLLVEDRLFVDDGLFVDDLSDDGFHGYDQNWMEEQDPFDIDMLPNDFHVEPNVWQPQLDADEEEEKEEFFNSVFVHDETVNTLQHGYRPSRPCTRVYMDDYSETTVMGNVQNQPGNSEGSWQNPKENDINYEDVLIFDTSSNDSAAATSYNRNFHEFAQKGTSVTTRTFKSQYQPRSHAALAEKGPRSIQLQSGFSSKNAVSRDKSNKDREMDQKKKTKEDLSRRSSESAGSNGRGASIFKEMPQLTSTPSPPSVYLCRVILGVILFIVIVIDVVGLR